MQEVALQPAATAPDDATEEQLARRRGPIHALRARLPRLTRARVVVAGVVILILLLWGAVIASSTSMYSAQVLVPEGGSIGIPPPRGLDFGDVPRGASAEKRIQLENQGRLDTYVVVFTWGGIRDLLGVSDAFFNMKPGDERTLTFEASIPISAPQKKYTGRVFVVRLPWWWP